MLAHPREMTIQEYFNDFSAPLSTNCSTCRAPLLRRFSFTFHAPLLAIDLPHNVPSLDGALHVNIIGRRCRYVLRGVVYYVADHFTARIVTKGGMVWFHDGMSTGSSLVYESQDMASIPIRNVVMAVYVRD